MFQGSDSQSTSASLLSRVRGRDSSAWDRFVRLYSPMVYSWARRSGLQDSDAADVVQDVFAVLSNQLDRYDAQRKEASFRGWLWGVTRNKLLEHARRIRKQPVGGGGTDQHLRMQNLDIPSDEPGISDVTGGLAKRALELIKTDFTEQTWEIFWRVVMVGEPAGKVAADLSVSVSSVYTAKSRVLKHLRAELEGLLD